VDNKRRSLMRQQFQKRQTVQKGKDRELGVRAGRPGRNREDQEYALVTRMTGLREKDNNPARDKGKSGTIYRGGNTGVRSETMSQEWLRAGEGNETIKETEETQRRHRGHTGETEVTQNRVLQYPPSRDAFQMSQAINKGGWRGAGGGTKTIAGERMHSEGQA